MSWTGFVAEINDLIEAAERVRGLGFIAKPTIVVLSPVEFSAPGRAPIGSARRREFSR